MNWSDKPILQILCISLSDKTHERMRICKRNRPFKKQKSLPHKFEWIEMEIAKNREEYGLIKTDLPKQKIEDKKS